MLPRRRAASRPATTTAPSASSRRRSQLDPDKQLDHADRSTNERAIELFDDTKARHPHARASARPSKQREAAENERLRKLRASLIVVRGATRTALNFVPFGAGQFQNGQHREGASASSAAQVATLRDVASASGSTSSTSTAFARDKVAARGRPRACAACSRSRSAPASRSSASTRSGVIDALRHYKPQTRTSRSTSRCRPSCRTLRRKKPTPQAEEDLAARAHSRCADAHARRRRASGLAGRTD